MTARTGAVTGLIAAGLFFSGIVAASTLNYNAIVGIDTLHLPSAFFAGVLMVGSILSAAVSVALGALSDRVRDRRLLVIACAIVGFIGFGSIFLFRSPPVFVVVTAAIMPFAAPLVSQTFSFTRSYYNQRAPERAEFMISILRTIFAVAWVVAPPIVGWVAATTAVFNVYAVAALAYLVVAAVYVAMLANPDARIGAPARRADGTSLEPARVDRVIAVGVAGVFLITIAIQINTVTAPLLITGTLGLTFGQLGIYAGLAAGLELPFMPLWGYLLRWVPKHIIIVAGGVLYAVYLFLLSRATGFAEVLWLQLLNGPATAALLSIPISYMQEAIRGRVGLSTSLLDVTRVAAVLCSSSIFAVVTAARPDYPRLFVIAGVLAIVGAAVLFAAHRVIRSAPRPAP